MSDDVEYRGIERFEGYRFGNDGSVWSCRGIGRSRRFGEWRRMKPQMTSINQHRQYRVYLRSNGKTVTALVHRLILEAFVGPCPEGMEACHNDGNPDNHRLDNLRWDTHAANMAELELHGTLPKGERNGLSKLTEIAVRTIRKLCAAGMTQKAAGELYGVDPATVSALIRKTWRHVH